MKINGIDEIQRSLRQLSARAEALDGAHEVPIEDLLTADFIHEHTGCGSVDQWFEASPFKIETTADFKAIPDAEWDKFVRTTTDFESCQAMLAAASEQYVQAKLFG